ncbi:MAG: ornithine carbamoyltransferase [Burkholderiales bacterium]|jgi:ornithine carbamoyltransferase|nr:ornithine carbamoyltransferase [Burkholderiales bacterium]
MAMPRHFLQFNDCSRTEIEYLFARTRWIKDRLRQGQSHHPLQGKTLAMIFEKSSTRTRVSFEAGMGQLGGNVICLSKNDMQLSRGETVEDTARVLSRMVDVVMIRTFAQTMVETFAAHSRVPIINGLTNEYHPCQVLADIYTFIEHRGPIAGKTVVWIGDPNNVFYTFLQAATLLNFKMHLSSPPGYPVDDARVTAAERAHLETFADPYDAAHGAALVTTDVWTSMGFEAENDQRRRDFQQWQVNTALMARAASDAVFMHCLPAHRGEEVTDDVIDGPQSLAWDEAENRMHAQKALLEFLLVGEVKTP